MRLSIGSSFSANADNFILDARYSQGALYTLTDAIFGRISNYVKLNGRKYTSVESTDTDLSDYSLISVPGLKNSNQSVKDLVASNDCAQIQINAFSVKFAFKLSDGVFRFKRLTSKELHELTSSSYAIKVRAVVGYNFYPNAVCEKFFHWLNTYSATVQLTTNEDIFAKSSLEFKTLPSYRVCTSKPLLKKYAKTSLIKKFIAADSSNRAVIQFFGLRPKYYNNTSGDVLIYGAEESNTNLNRVMLEFANVPFIDGHIMLETFFIALLTPMPEYVPVSFENGFIKIRNIKTSQFFNSLLEKVSTEIAEQFSLNELALEVRSNCILYYKGYAISKCFTNFDAAKPYITFSDGFIDYALQRGTTDLVFSYLDYETPLVEKVESHDFEIREEIELPAINKEFERILLNAIASTNSDFKSKILSNLKE